MNRCRTVVGVFLGLILAMSLTSATALAQGAERETAEISEAQQTLNDEGVRAMIEGDFAGAVALLERSIRMGENNVTYLNLGRAYQKLGNCEKARKALVMAKTAPAVKDPPEDEVTQRAEEFLGELDEACGSEPPPEDVGAVEMDDEATGSDDPSEGDAMEDDAVQPVEPPSNSTSTLGIATLAPGIALMGTGVALHFVAQGQRNQVTDPSQTNEQGIVEPTQADAYALRDSANTLDTVALGMLIGGGVLSAVGTILIINGSSGEADVATVSPSVGPRGVGVSIGGRF